MVWQAKLFVLLAVMATAVPARAATLRKQQEQKGDFLLIGNTLGWDCAATVAPVVGVVPTAGNCGANTADSGADVMWRADQPVGSATASMDITSDQARSTAVLSIPSGATVTYARLYWAAQKAAAPAGSSALVERPGGFSTRVTADISHTAMSPGGNPSFYYHSSVEVTDLVTANGSGAYRVGSIDALPLANLNEPTAFAAWALVVFYRRDSEPQRNLALFDGMDALGSRFNKLVTSVTLQGFHVPQSGFDGKLGVVAYEGDNTGNGDSLIFGGTQMSNAVNPANNFFNGTRSLLGVAVSNAGDLPQLTGGPGSYSGVDIDVIDVTRQLVKDQTMVTIDATTGGENFFLGAFVTSITSYKPEFSSGSTKTVQNLTRTDGITRPGDTVRYTITVKNQGNDIAINTMLTDVLPAGISYVLGTLQITAGANAGPKTDATGDDQGEYVAATRTLKVRLGAGANATMGGEMAINETATVVFQATVDSGTAGMTVVNNATISAAGKTGDPQSDYGAGGGKGTPLPVDMCVTDAECASVAGKPFCLTSADPNICVECKDNSMCPMAKPICSASSHTCVPMCGGDQDCAAPTPACQASGFCGQCSATNKSACMGMTPQCDVAAGKCVECLSKTDCPSTLPLCDLPTHTCVGCTGNADCPPGKPFCDTTTKMCRSCVSDADCGGATPACLPTGLCAECSMSNPGRCMGATPVCDATAGKCVACVTSAMCMGATPFCDPASKMCRACKVDGECPDSAVPACQPSGACGECSMSNATRCMGATPACDVAAGKCVACVTNAMCMGAAPVCDAGTKMCRACMNDTECGGLVCLATGACAECTAGNTSRCVAPRPFCDVGANRCVGCLSNNDCSGPSPFCSPATRACSPCDTDGPPSCSDPARPACQKSGMLSGACTECSAGNASRCMAAKPICLAQLGLCGCTDTDGDSECGGPMSGVVCNGAVGQCIPGCVAAIGRNTCPVGQVCSNPVGGIGTCVVPPPGCGGAVGCPSPQPICDTTVRPPACVQCLSDVQCGAPQVCDDGRSKKCVECTSAKLKNCQPTLSGAICLTNNTCGCASDRDCGAVNSGRVCDTLVSKCTIGCRGFGGNTCPAGLICSSRDMSIGRCMPGDGGVAPPDAGVDRPSDAVIPTGDGGSRPDADGGRPNDAGTVQKGFLGGGGCACAVPGQADTSPGPSGLGAIAFAALLLLRRRRRR